MTEIQVLDRGMLFDGGALRAMWFRIRDRAGRTRYRGVCLRELAYLPIEARNDPDVLGKQWAALRGLYNAGVDFSYTAMGVYHPRRVGVVQFYGAAAEGEARDAAVEDALRRMAAVEAVLANYPQSRLQAPDTERVQWLVERLERLPRVLAVLGHPDPRLARKGLGRDGSMGEADDELMSQQGETFLRGLAALEEDFVFAVMAAHVGRGELARGLVKMAQVASQFASRQRGSIGASFSIAVPLAAALAGNYGSSRGRGDSHARSTAEGVSEAWGEHEARTVSHTRSHSVTESEAHTRSVAETDSWAHTRSHAETESTAETSSWARTTGGAVTHGTAETEGEGRTESYVRTRAQATGTSWSQAETTGEAITTGRSWGTSRAEARTTGTNRTASVGVGVSGSESLNVSWPAVTKTEGASSGRSYPNPDNPPVTVSRGGVTVNRNTTNYGSFEQAYRAVMAYGSEQGVVAAKMADAVGAPMDQVAAATPPQYGTVSMGPGQQNTTVSGGGNVGLKGILGLGGQHSQGQSTPVGPTVSAQYGQVVQQGVSGPAPGPAGNSVSVQAAGETLTEGKSEATTRPLAPAVGATKGLAASVNIGGSVTEVDTTTVSQGSFEAQSEATTRSRSVTTSRGGFRSETQGEAWGTAVSRSRSVTRSEARTDSWANTVGGATTRGDATTDGWAVTRGHAVTRGEAWTTGRAETRGEAWTEGETRGTSHQVARSHVEGAATAYSLARSGSRGFVGGFGGSIVPGFALTRSWQTEDDVAIRLTELTRMLESLLNQASAEGGFLTTALLLTTDRGAKAAAALIPQAFHGPNVPTPVLTVEGKDELRLHALTARPSLEPDGDPFHAGLWTRWGTLLTPGMLAAYTAPNLFEEGTAVTVQERIPPMAFYPETEGEVVIGHQVSPETGRLTTTPLRLSRKRHFHTAFIGDTGYGKSVAAERIAYETTLRWQMKTIILDFGAGWRKMLNAPGLEGHVDIRQLSPGGPRPLRWNPLQIGRHILPEVQWRAFADIFGNVAKLGERRQIHELREALRQVYLAAGVLVDDPEVRDDPGWGWVRDAGEARVTAAAVGTPLRDLDRDTRQRLAVYRSKFVGFTDLYAHIEAEVQNIPPRDIRRSILEGILYRLHPLVQGAAAAQYAAGMDVPDINEVVPGDWGIVVLEGGAFLDEFSKAFLLAWAAYHVYTDAVVQRIRRARSRGWEVQLFFEEANKMLGGLDGKSEEGGPSTAEQFEAMWRDSRKYGIALHVITQSPSQVPQGILSSCNNIVISQTKNPKDRDLVVAMIHRSEKGFVDETWRRFIGSIPVARAVVKLGYSFDRARVEPVYVQPLLLDAAEPTDEEIAARLGEIRL